MKTLFKLILFISYSLFLFQELSAEDSILEMELVYLNKRFTLSNFLESELNNNITLSEHAYGVILSLEKNIEKFPEFFPDYLHLSYKLANFFQQYDRGADGEIVTHLAILAFERKYPQIQTWDALEVCKMLAKEHPRLPSLYAAILHYEGKNYFYQLPVNESNNVRFLDKAEQLIKRSIDIRKIIDDNIDHYEEPNDSGKEANYCSHTLLFKRSMGKVFLERNQYVDALKIYENNINYTTNDFEKVASATKCVEIYTKITHEEWNPKKSYPLFQKANIYALYVLDYLKKKNFSGAPEAAVILSKFYGDKTNPFYDNLKSKDILENYVNNKRKFSKKRISMLKKRLGQLYQEKARELIGESIEAEQELIIIYQETLTTPLLGPSLKNRIKKVIDLAKLYRGQKKYFEATLLLSNILSHIDENESKFSNKLWYQLYLTEQEYLLSTHQLYNRKDYELTFTAYKATVQRYKRALEKMRNDFEKIHLNEAWLKQEQLQNQVIQIIESIFKETSAAFTPSPVPYAIVGLGSLSHQLFTPYSDLEYVLVHDKLQDTQDRVYFDQLLNIFLMRLIAIQETPLQLFGSHVRAKVADLSAPQGFRPDNGGIIGGSKNHTKQFYGTTQEVIAQIPSLSWTIILNQGLALFGSKDIYILLKEETEKIIKTTTQKDWELLLADIFANKQTCVIKVNEKGNRYFTFKYPYYRAISLLLQHLAAYHAIGDHSPRQILQDLVNKGLITVEDHYQVDHFLKKLITLRSKHYLKKGSQNEEVMLHDIELQEYLQLNEIFQTVFFTLLKGFPFYQTYRHNEKKIDRLHTLCRSGYLDLAEKEIESDLMSEAFFPGLWEIRGDIALLRMNPVDAFWHYQRAYEKNPTQITLLFKLAEASIYMKNRKNIIEPILLLDFFRNSIFLINFSTICPHMFSKFIKKSAQRGLNFPIKASLERILLDEIEIHLKKEWRGNPFLKVKADYLRVLLERKRGNWDSVERILGDLKVESNWFVKQGTLVHALVEIEKGRLYGHKGLDHQAIHHFKQGERLVLGKYGPLHPYILPFYEELLSYLDDSEILEKANYREKIMKIKNLFPEMRWQGALDSFLLD